MKRILLSLAAALCMCASAAAQTVAPFKDGDRAVFLGNSITDGGHYHSYIWLYYMTRFPYMDLRVMNAGIGGETAGDMYKRLDGDVLSKRPTVLTVTFGMNDTGYMEYNGDDAGAFGEKKYRECYDNFKKMEKRLQTLDGVRVVMLGGSPYDETAQIENNAPLRGKNAVMDRVVGFQKESAAANGWEFVDFSAPMVEIGRRVQAGQPSFSLSMGDRIHPDNDGHMVMAYLYLKAQGFAGREVADVQIDAANAKVLKAGNCEITGLRRNGREISFDYLAEHPEFLALLTDLQAPLREVSEHYRSDPKTVGGSLFRIHRDTRFSNDKAPYKNWQGARLFHDAKHAAFFYLLPRVGKNVERFRNYAERHCKHFRGLPQGFRQLFRFYPRGP